jgi:DNA-binding transcriptional regulator GbsR (MarR family)
MIDLNPAATRFILHWGEMGSRWGVNRTVAQIHALLYIAPRPLNADEIARTLSIARSNVSTSLRELQAWGIVKVVHTLGDRRDNFESIRDVWQLFRAIVAERFQREIEPTLGVLAECVAEAEGQSGDEEDTLQRLTELHGFFQTLESWRRQVLDMSPREMKRASKIGSKVRRLLRTGS